MFNNRWPNIFRKLTALWSFRKCLRWKLDRWNDRLICRSKFATLMSSLMYWLKILFYVMFQHCFLAKNQKVMKKLTENQTSTMIRVNYWTCYIIFVTFFLTTFFYSKLVWRRRIENNPSNKWYICLVLTKILFWKISAFVWILKWLASKVAFYRRPVWFTRKTIW